MANPVMKPRTTPVEIAITMPKDKRKGITLYNIYIMNIRNIYIMNLYILNNIYGMYKD